MDMAEKYLIVIEKGESNFSAYSPDVPGCIATGTTLDETVVNMRSALLFHFDGLQEAGETLPIARGIESYVEATQDSEGEEYFFTHIDINLVTEPISV